MYIPPTHPHMYIQKKNLKRKQFLSWRSMMSLISVRSFSA